MNSHLASRTPKLGVVSLSNSLAIPCNSRLDFEYSESQPTSFRLIQSFPNSMDGKGRATDNICIERFWRSAKCERIYLNEYDSMAELKEDVDDYIDFYNHKRFHETLKYKKPMNTYHESIFNQQELKKAA